MSTTRFNLSCKTAVLVAVLLLVLAPIASASGTKDRLVVTAVNSNGGLVPSGSGNEWHYDACVNSSFSDTLKFKVKVMNDDDNAPEGPFMVSFSKAGDPAVRDYATLPGTFGLMDNGSEVMANVAINTAAMGNGQHNLNIMVSASGAVQGQGGIHLNITVGGCDDPPAYRCFLTSSEFGFLGDCSGNLVTESFGGRFEIVSPQGTARATNPGQIYYNLLWENQGDSDQMTINVNSTALSAVGAGSLHAYTFDSSEINLDDLLSLTYDQFEEVNTAGLKCNSTAGSHSGVCVVAVPAGRTLWVTWHLSWDGLGSSTDGIANACSSADAAISVDGAGVGLTTPNFSCSASASGYVKTQ